MKPGPSLNLRCRHACLYHGITLLQQNSLTLSWKLSPNNFKVVSYDLFSSGESKCKYCILWSIVWTFYSENDAEIFPAHCTWKVAERGFKIAFMMNKPCNEWFLWNYCWKIKTIFRPKIIWKFRYALTILVCTLYSIKYDKHSCFFASP